MIDAKSIQRALKARGVYGGPIDGDIGPATRAAVRTAVLRTTALPAAAKWGDARRLVAFQQIMMREAGIEVGKIDGFAGPQTLFALERWQDRLRDIETPEEFGVRLLASDVPRQSEAARVYGAPGTNQVRLELPYPMRLAWNPGEAVRSFTINRLAADSAKRALTKIKDHYGEQRIKDLRLDLFGGCFNNRKMRGGKSLSMHAYAAAIDFDPTNNQMRWGRNQAALARPDYDAFWRFWEEEGWVSLGRERNYDWMHVQRARL
ncbi:MAG: hypothetical protein N2444_00365 [Methylocystis sp.]|nr:hypothetical protein [Methylocystis sp.]